MVQSPAPTVVNAAVTGSTTHEAVVQLVAEYVNAPEPNALAGALTDTGITSVVK